MLRFIVNKKIYHAFSLIILFITIFNIINSNNLFGLMSRINNFDRIIKKNNEYFFDDTFLNIFKNGVSKEFIFSNKFGEVFIYHNSGNIVKIIDLKKILSNKKILKKDKFSNIKIINNKISDEIIISIEDTIFYFKKNNLNDFKNKTLVKFYNKKQIPVLYIYDLKWSIKSFQSINLNSIILKDDMIFLSKSNNSIECIDKNTGKKIWIFDEKITRSFKTLYHPVIFFKDNILYSSFYDGKIYQINYKNGAILSKSFIGDTLLNKIHHFYDINISNNLLLNKFEFDNLLVLNNDNQFIYNIKNNKIIYEFKNQYRFQKVFYVKQNEIIAIYKDNFIFKINFDIKNNKADTKVFKIKQKVLYDNLRNMLDYSALIKKSDDYFYRSPKIFLDYDVTKSKLIIFNKKNTISFFDIEKEIFY